MLIDIQLPYLYSVYMSVPIQAVAVTRLRKLDTADKLRHLPKFRYLYNMLCLSKRRALTDKECAVIVQLTDAAIKELK